MTGTMQARPVPVTGDSFRDALARHAAGVVVVTSQPASGGPAGLTATSFTSVSLAPPLVSFYVAVSSSTFPRLRAAPAFAVNVLGHDQAEVAGRFAARDVDRFAAPTRWRRGPAGEPLLDGAAVRLRCGWHSVQEIGDHLLVVGRVVAVELGAAGTAPLLYHRGRFGRFAAHRRRG
ncbi:MULTISPECIES: flavin reductase family protein [Thermomonosporaceae]|uniref:flavin reductase family protein n=1 Tax=Thermomonosporaceae TaxID=2012 RepID=UPI00255AE0BD|nr:MULTISPECIES: flavin reductase family protein [Thermomonosporaceae]MDL4777544.1 flavin reductase family protein [Actinomadura xylanilytica]